MASRKPVVLGPDGLAQQLQSGDTTTIHAKFTGTITPPALALLGSSTVTVAGLTPLVQGDALAAGETITLHINQGSTLPTGMVVSFEPQVTAPNTVTVKIAALVALSAGSAVPVTVVAHR